MMTYDSPGTNSQTRIAVMQLLFLHLFFRHPLSPGFRCSMAILLASRNPIHAYGEARLPVTASASSLRQVVCLSQQCRFRWRHRTGAISDTFKLFCIFNRLSTLVLSFEMVFRGQRSDFNFRLLSIFVGFVIVWTKPVVPIMVHTISRCKIYCFSYCSVKYIRIFFRSNITFQTAAMASLCKLIATLLRLEVDVSKSRVSKHRDELWRF